MRRLLDLTRRGRQAPHLRDLLHGMVCWVRGCDLHGQFCQRCWRFLP